MKPEQQRIAIAEACGYRNIALREDPDEGFGPLLTGFKNDNQFDEQIPDYLNSLNAMHKAEKTLDFEQSELFEDELCDVTFKDNDGLENPLPCRFSVCHATAAQRAEAFLKTIGKWID